MADAAITQQASAYVGKRGLPGDSYNAVMALQLNLGDAEAWPRIKPVKTYAAYIREEKIKNREIADEVIRLSDAKLVAQFDRTVVAINKIIGDGVKSEQQAKDIWPLVDELRFTIYCK
jgi:hypothetical protein